MSKFSLKDLVKEEIEAPVPKSTLWEPITIEEKKDPVKEFSSKTSRIGSLSSLNEDLKENKTVVKSGWTPLVQKVEEAPKQVFPSAKPSGNFKALTDIFKEELAPKSKPSVIYEKIELPPIVDFKKTAEEERDELVQSFTEQIKVEEQNRSIESSGEESNQEPEPVAEEAIEEPVVEETKERTLIDRASEFITKELKTEENSYQQPVAPPTAQNFKEVTRKLKFLEEWLAKISITGPGGGAGDVINLDFPVKLITGDYTVNRKDYYIGVNAASIVNITLPDEIGFPGRKIIIKDESGRCSKFPIIVTGNVDNDPDGFILKINNGGIQMIYRNGWRII